MNPKLLFGVLVLLSLAASTANARGARDAAVPAEQASADTVRLPFQAGKVYDVRLIPGAPFCLELPPGESARNIWVDNRWWAAESTPGSSRVFLRALGTQDVIGRRGFMHIETEPSDLRIALRVEAVAEDAAAAAGLQIFVEGSTLNDPVKLQARKLADKELVYADKKAQDQARVEFESWRKNMLANMRASYEWGGDFRIARAVDDGVQTFITLPDASDRAVIQFVDRAGKAEIVNHELENGTYVVQNKVLHPGEKFRLVLGKQQAWVALK